MKKIFFFIVIAIFSVQFAYTQVSRGLLSIGGNVGLNYQSTESGRLEGLLFQFSPNAAYAITDHFMLGGGLWFTTFSSESNIDVALNITPLVRYYFNPSSSSLNYFTQVEANFGIKNVEQNLYSLTFGANKFLNPNIALEGGLSYTYIDPEDEGRVLNLYAFNFGLRAFISSNELQDQAKRFSKISKGVLMLGANKAELTLSETTFTAGFTPNIAYFISDHFAIGGTIGLRYTTGRESLEFWNGNISIQPFCRYYLNPSAKLAWFAQSSIAYSISRVEVPFDFVTDTSAIEAGLSVGGNLFLTPNFAVELATSWTFTDLDSELEGLGVFPPNATAEEQINTLGLNIGFQYFWNRNHNEE